MVDPALSFCWHHDVGHIAASGGGSSEDTHFTFHVNFAFGAGYVSGRVGDGVWNVPDSRNGLTPFGISSSWTTGKGELRPLRLCYPGGVCYISKNQNDGTVYLVFRGEKEDTQTNEDKEAGKKSFAQFEKSWGSDTQKVNEYIAKMSGEEKEESDGKKGDEEKMDEGGGEGKKKRSRDKST